MFFTILPVDCVMEILEKMEPSDIRKVKMVNQRMKNIVENVYRMIYKIEFNFKQKHAELKVDTYSKPIRASWNINGEDSAVVSNHVKQATIIENIYIMDWFIENWQVERLINWFSSLGLRKKLSIQHIHFEGAIYYQHPDSLPEFLNSLNYQYLHFNNLYCGKNLKNEFFALKNLRSLVFVKMETNGEVYCELGPETLERLRERPLEYWDLQAFKTQFRCSDVVQLIKFALDSNLKVYWHFGQIFRTTSEDRRSIQSLKDRKNAVTVEPTSVHNPEGTIREYYTIKSPNGTFRFNARKM